MPVARIIASYSENEKDTITLLCGVDEKTKSARVNGSAW